MVLQTFDIGLNGGENVPPYPGDYAPTTNSYYTELDSSIYSQGTRNIYKTYEYILNLNRM